MFKIDTIKDTIRLKSNCNIQLDSIRFNLTVFLVLIELAGKSGYVEICTNIHGNCLYYSNKGN